MKKFLILLLSACFAFSAGAQILQPVKWSFSAQRTSEKEAIITAVASIDAKWHLYSQFIPSGGPEPTSFSFKASPDYSLAGKVSESPKPTKIYDETFEMNLSWFTQKATFKQKIRLNTKNAISIGGSVYFMTCDDKQCLPPDEVEFNIPIKAFGEKSTASEIAATPPKEAPANENKNTTTATSAQSAEQKDSSATITDSVKQNDTIAAAPAKETPASTATVAEKETEEGSLWGIFIAGFLGGFLALLTPCVFPMIPLTVSYFTKRGGLFQAMLYGISIIVLYVGLGMLVTVLFGADALNDLASNVYFNLLFFVMLIVFGVSFLGAFEITLPNSWINKMDSQSDKGGLLGIFFMAFTLALVSFSCTGPIIGTLLVQAAVDGEAIGPIVGMTGFSLALALPFSLFAMFPSWLKSLPKSGGWLNSVKVVLGFLELAFALKFLSNVDLAYHLGILDREVFLVIWIVLFALLGMYLLGKIKFSHDSDVAYVSIPRLFFAIAAFAFSIYMIPGLWGAPLNAISAFAPPQATQDFDLSRVQLNNSSSAAPAENHKYSDLFHCPHGLNCFFDYEEGMAYAKKTGKPVFIDFTGHSCVNCRKMEASVWSDPEVLKRLNEDYVLISLYVDDKTSLPENEQYVSAVTKKKIKTIGNKWSDIQTSQYGINSQPYYVLLDHNGQKLVAPQAFNLDIPNYVAFLDSGKAAFARVK